MVTVKKSISLSTLADSWDDYVEELVTNGLDDYNNYFNSLPVTDL
jgi:hypothetical protein